MMAIVIASRALLGHDGHVGHGGHESHEVMGLRNEPAQRASFLVMNNLIKSMNTSITTCITTNHLYTLRFMDELEVFGLLVACLCHDLDHRGTNNSYQTKVLVPPLDQTL